MSISKNELAQKNASAHIGTEQILEEQDFLSTQEELDSQQKNKESQMSKVQDVSDLKAFIKAFMEAGKDAYIGEYLRMQENIRWLVNALEEIEARECEDGKNVGMEDVEKLRALYQNAFESTQDFISRHGGGKKGKAFQRRYEIAGEMLKLLEKDRGYLSKVVFKENRRYSLEELLRDARQEVIEICEADLGSLFAEDEEELLAGQDDLEEASEVEDDAQEEELSVIQEEPEELEDELAEAEVLSASQEEEIFSLIPPQLKASELAPPKFLIPAKKEETTEEKKGDAEKVFAPIAAKAFTPTTVFQTTPAASPYGEFAAAKGTAVMPEIAVIAEVKQDYIDAFFREAPISAYLRDLRLGRLASKDRAAQRKMFENALKEHLTRLWKERGVALTRKDAVLFPQNAKNPLLESFNKLAETQKEAVVSRLITIGMEYDKLHQKTETAKRAGIKDGANLEKRGAAMSIVAKHIGTGGCIAESKLAQVTVRGRDDAKTAEKGVLSEWIEGLSADAVRKGIADGSIVCDNESVILRQLADIQVTDYICGNINRGPNQIFMKMAKSDDGTDHIEQIVGIGNEMSFGLLDADGLSSQTLTLTPPALMQLMRQETAERILEMDREMLFFELGGAVTDEEKKSLWTRVEQLQFAIADTLRGKARKGLRIKDDDAFADESLQDIANANYHEGNLYKSFYAHTGYAGVEQKGGLPHRLATEEQRVLLTMDQMDAKKEYAINDGYVVMTDFLLLPQGKQRKLLANEKDLRRLLGHVQGAAEEFDASVGKLFSQLTETDSPQDEAFAGDYAQAHGVTKLLDIFYIDGKRATDVFRSIPDIADALIKAPGFSPEEADRREVTDMVGKAFVMGVLTMGERQVTIANFQQKRDGSEEAVITDLNVLRECAGGKLPPDVKDNDATGDGKLITESRAGREERFKKIREDICGR